MKCVYHPDYDDESKRSIILADMPGEADWQSACRQSSVPDGCEPWVRKMHSWALLTAGQERHLFRKMNCLKHLGLPFAGERDRLVCCNQRLALKAAHGGIETFGGIEESYSEMIGTIVHAVDMFDWSTGYRFSTYAIRAMRSTIGFEIRRKGRMKNQAIQADIDIDLLGCEDNLDSRDTAIGVRRAMLWLTEREREIIHARFMEGLSFKESGERIGLRCDGARRVETQALKRMRRLFECPVSQRDAVAKLSFAEYRYKPKEMAV
mgnify:CR=1 FL=1